VPEEKTHNTHLEYRVALERLIAEGSRRFINATVQGVDREVDTVLKEMGEFAKVDRSYIFLFSEDGRYMNNTNEWCAPGVEPQIEVLQGLSVETFPWLVRELEQGNNINLTSIDELPPEASNEKETLRMQDIQSLAIVPMNYAGELKGYLGFDFTKKRVHWKEEDFFLLRTMGDIIMSALMRRRMERQLILSRKMEALGRFAGGIAHDFNNLLTTIKGNIQLLMSSCSLNEEQRDLVDAAVQATDSGSALTSQLLNFSRSGEHARETFHLNQVLADSLQMLQRLIPHNVRIETYFLAHNDLLTSDRSQIEQIVMNLVKNGADAMQNGGAVTILTRNTRFQNTDLIRGSGVVPGEYVQLQVLDTGCGMSSDTIEKALEPFFSTKDRGRGTGLGLSTVYTIVQQHAGYIEIASKKNEGTTVDIYLPTGG
jgi:signal transduction histidine kinase